MIWIVVTVLIAAVFCVMLTLRWTDARSIDSAWNLLRLGIPSASRSQVFDVSMVQDLPAPARKYFLYAIEPGTPIKTIAEIEMTGKIGLGTNANPNYRPITAKQILSPPKGMVWQVAAGLLDGSDGATLETSWTRFWLYGLFPIVRAGGNLDHRRSAFGRVVAEGLIWVPGAMLPSEFAQWQAVDDHTARVTVKFGDLEQAVDIEVSDDGQPVKVSMMRWSNANDDKKYRLQPFGGYLSGFKSFGGYNLPTHVIGGNFIGTDSYFPFYYATVTSIELIEPT